MSGDNWFWIAVAAIGFWLLAKIIPRLQLSLAKHPSIAGHAKWSRRLAKLVPYYALTEQELVRCDLPPEDVVSCRRAALRRLQTHLARKPSHASQGPEPPANPLQESLSDLKFTNRYRVPFPFSEVANRLFPLDPYAAATQGAHIVNSQGGLAFDLTGSYGVNVFGHEFYKNCISTAARRVADVGVLLGPYQPDVGFNAERLREISGLDEVSFHMSGTEAVMQAVRLARYHTKRSKIVTFCGAYHGWWDGVQPGVGNPVGSHDIFMLKEMSTDTLRVLNNRRDIACVLVNPLQALHPNRNAPGDSLLIGNGRKAHFDRQAYTDWLHQLRVACDRRGIALLFDEVFLGFRLAYGGAQEYFGVAADLVTYGKTLGGGLPVGVLCGKRRFMQRYREDQPANICFARGTFNSHPLVMATMRGFLEYVAQDEVRTQYAQVDSVWDSRRARVNSMFREHQLPLSVANMASVWTVLYDLPTRFNWLYQYYLREQGLALSWVGSGRFTFSHSLTDAEFEEIAKRLVRAGRNMLADGWWWYDAERKPWQYKMDMASEAWRYRQRVST